jgi:hypothetical protein
MHDTKEWLSLFSLFASMNYLYVDVLALRDAPGRALRRGLPGRPWPTQPTDVGTRRQR